MSHARYLVGDVFDRMAELPDGSVDLILTSPPFLALRSYLPADHPDKGKEIGSEATPAEFVDTLLRLSAEWRRLLAPHGSLCVELGDTYAGSGGAGGDYLNAGLRDGQPRFDGSAARGRAQDREYDGGASDRWDFAKPGTNSRAASGVGWPLAKSLSLTPEAYRFALAYGINPHTGQPSPAGRWRVRNVIRWVRPNPPVGALGDKFRPATSEMVVACVSGSRYFDLDSVREPLSERRQADGPNVKTAHGKTGQANVGDTSWHTLGPYDPSTSAGAPPLDWWKLSPGGYPGSHYAVWPAELCVKPIKAMSPERVCVECGEPSRRIVETERPQPTKNGDYQTGRLRSGGDFPSSVITEYTTLGWSDCGHGDNWRPGLVLDPFAGSGTTLAVATGHGRDAIGIDLDERNAELARERIGELFLTVEAA
jgi:hypothetical protein